MKGVPFLSKMVYTCTCRRVRVIGPRGGASPYKTLLSTTIHVNIITHNIVTVVYFE